jgi:hypothetical protein
MGQQQLLLIVLVMIMVGASILVGLQIYDANYREASIDTIKKDLLYLSTLAISYYRTPVEYGGGGQSFSNGGNYQWSVPNELDSLDNRTYAVNTISDNAVELVGQSSEIATGEDGTEGVKVYIAFDEYRVTDMRVEN